MWFLLTGSAPSALPTTESGPRLSASIGAVPRFVRNLVSRMVRTNPEERPQDPAAFAEKIHACLQKAERQTAFTRSFAPAAIPTIPIREKKRIAPALALAAAIAVLASLGAFYFVRSQRESKPLGVIIGVPETAEASSLPVTASASPVARCKPSRRTTWLGRSSNLRRKRHGFAVARYKSSRRSTWLDRSAVTGASGIVEANGG